MKRVTTQNKELQNGIQRISSFWSDAKRIYLGRQHGNDGDVVMKNTIKAQVNAIAVLASFALGGITQHLVTEPHTLTKQEIIALPGTPIIWDEDHKFIVIGHGDRSADVYTLTSKGYVLSSQSRRFGLSKIITDAFGASVGVMVGHDV
jgi:hypothetical protein